MLADAKEVPFVITVDQLVQASRMLRNPDPSTLRKLAEADELTTKWDSPCYISQVRNRSAKATFIVQKGVSLGVQQQGMSADEADALASKVHQYLRENGDLIQIDRTLGTHPSTHMHCRLYISRRFAQIGYMWHQMLFAGEPDTAPDLVSIYVPEWPERRIFAYPITGITYILGTDYFGEAKKSFLRMAMFRMKQQGGLGLHAGSKLLRARDISGNIRETGFILFGLSGTGKTTLTIHDHGLSGDEGVRIRQDDVVLMDQHGTCYGTERGFYIKTEGLDPSQRVLYKAATTPHAIFENVKVGPNGEVDFNDTSLTANGRAVVLREEVELTDAELDLPKAHKVIFITRRNDIVPPVARLTSEQAAAFFMLGESIETSAGDPTKAGQSKREVGTNPFIVGPESDEGNRFLRILRDNPDMECYLLNTGSVGAGPDSPGQKVSIQVSTTIMREIARGSITWRLDPDWHYEVPLQVPDLDLAALDPTRYYSSEEYDARVEKLRRERLEWLQQFPDLMPEIVEAIR